MWYRAKPISSGRGVGPCRALRNRAVVAPMSDLDYDVIVVGGGGAGMTAALFAHEAGAKVLILEADKKLGGATALSDGVVYAAGTRVQKDLGIVDSPEAMFDYVMTLESGASLLSNRDSTVLRGRGSRLFHRTNQRRPRYRCTSSRSRSSRPPNPWLVCRGRDGRVRSRNSLLGWRDGSWQCDHVRTNRRRTGRCCRSSG